MATMNEESYGRIAKMVVAYLQSNAEITNRKLRQISGISYDQAIHFFGRMCEEGQLLRIGTTAATRYIRRDRHHSQHH
jgi:hypothetical protein